MEHSSSKTNYAFEKKWEFRTIYTTFENILADSSGQKNVHMRENNSLEQSTTINNFVLKHSRDVTTQFVNPL